MLGLLFFFVVVFIFSFIFKGKRITGETHPIYIFFREKYGRKKKDTD